MASAMTGQATWLDQARDHPRRRNRGGSDRSILLFEIWRPDINAEERAQLTQIFSAIDNYSDQ